MSSCSTPTVTEERERKKNNNISHKEKKRRRAQHRKLAQEASEARRECETIKDEVSVLGQTITDLTADLIQKNKLIAQLQQEQKERTESEILDKITQLRRKINDFQKNQ